MKIESLSGQRDLLFLAYVLGVQLPRHWPHCVGGVNGDGEDGRVRVHFLQPLGTDDLRYVESKIATHLPMTWAIEATCATEKRSTAPSTKA